MHWYTYWLASSFTAEEVVEVVERRAKPRIWSW
jgi:hypothetical protein